MVHASVGLFGTTVETRLRPLPYNFQRTKIRVSFKTATAFIFSLVLTFFGSPLHYFYVARVVHGCPRGIFLRDKATLEKNW